MNVELTKAFRAYLLADSAVSTLLSAQRLYANKIPQGKRDSAAVYQRISETTNYHFRGQSSVVHTRVQVTCWSINIGDAVNLSDKIHARLSGASGFWPYGTNSPRDTVEVLGVFALTQDDIYDQTADLNGVSRDYEIIYQES